MALAKKKKVVKRSPSRRGAKLSSPKWDDWETLSGAEYHRKKEAARAFYYENYQAKDMYAFVFSWMAKNGYTNEDIKLAKLPSEHMISITCAICCRLLLDGMPDFNQKEDDYWQTLPGTGGNITPLTDFIKKRISETIASGKKINVEKMETEESEAKKNFHRPSIQELLRLKAISMTDELEEFIDTFDMNINSLKTFKPINILRKQEAKANHAKVIKEYYVANYNEYDELINPPSTKGMDEKALDYHNQLIEGYNHLDKSEIKAMYELYKGIVQACDILIANAKFDRKPRKRKPISAEKLVAKMKFCKEHVDTGLVSINPIEIIGSNILLIYNTKSRKVGVYHTSNVDPMNQKRDGSGLTVKGTTMLRFNEETSIQKTLRKPQEQLKIFKDINKRSLNKQFEAVKSVPTKMNGRINEHTLLLKVF